MKKNRNLQEIQNGERGVVRKRNRLPNWTRENNSPLIGSKETQKPEWETKNWKRRPNRGQRMARGGPTQITHSKGNKEMGRTAGDTKERSRELLSSIRGRKKKGEINKGDERARSFQINDLFKG